MKQIIEILNSKSVINAFKQVEATLAKKDVWFEIKVEKERVILEFKGLKKEEK